MKEALSSQTYTGRQIGLAGALDRQLRLMPLIKHKLRNGCMQPHLVFRPSDGNRQYEPLSIPCTEDLLSAVTHIALACISSLDKEGQEQLVKKILKQHNLPVRALQVEPSPASAAHFVRNTDLDRKSCQNQI